MLRLSISLLSAVLLTAQPQACDPPLNTEPLAALAAGNARFTGAEPKRPHQNIECARRLASGQKPFAVILTCADSRVSPEVLFDQGIGDLFVVRVAGNVATADALGSIEYAVDHLDTKLVVVMGHRRCGAVQAAFCPRPPAHLDVLWDLLRPAVAAPLAACDRHQSPTAEDWDSAVRKNASNMTAMVSKDLHNRTGIQVATGYYDLEDGKVTLTK
jgi:carbonic anhydrase